jgi:hypothetical protein
MVLASQELDGCDAFRGGAAQPELEIAPIFVL